MRQDYFPDREAEQSNWAINFKTKLPLYAASLGIDPATEATLIANCDSITNQINNVEVAKNTLKNVIAQKNTVKGDAVKLLRKEIARAKTAQNYTAAIGDDLGIIGSEVANDYSTFKPTINGESFPGYVRLSFLKEGTDGVNIYTRLKGFANFTFLARDTFSPYDDTRPLSTAGQAETREYMAIAVIDDEQVGQQSDIVTVVFGG
jgi:hypothetical protein